MVAQQDASEETQQKLLSSTDNQNQDSLIDADETIRRQKSNPAPGSIVRPASQSSGQLTVPVSSKTSKNEPPLSPYAADGAREEANCSSLLTDSEESCSKHLRQMDYLPESERGVEWSSLVDAATRAIENMTQKALSLDYTSETNAYRLKYEAAQKRVAMLEGKVDRLQLELARERESKRLLELDLLTERNANKKLEEECVNANIELKKFAEWFVNAIENTNKPHQQSSEI
uniref:Signal-induced proliferation-associated 1-like protein C-terminal domain-containing protein n=1 Tax=Romanomermis culicivorax TaxID=13658 RepID=A0A915JMK4_ROMCU